MHSPITRGREILGQIEAVELKRRQSNFGMVSVCSVGLAWDVSGPSTPFCCVFLTACIYFSDLSNAIQTIRWFFSQKFTQLILPLCSWVYFLKSQTPFSLTELPSCLINLNLETSSKAGYQSVKSILLLFLSPGIVI